MLKEIEPVLPNVHGMHIVKRQADMASEIEQELRNSTSPRVEILLATNYAEFILKDFVQFLLNTEEARDIPRQLIVNILEDKELINKKLAHDVRQIFSIRDAYAHKPSLNEANEFVEKHIIPKLNCVKDETPKEPDWEKRPLTQKIFDVSAWVFVQLRGNFHAMVTASFVKID